MKFKHSFHVFVDNFSVTYKHMLYRLAVTLIATGLYAAVIYPFAKALTGSPEYTQLIGGIKDFFKNLVEGHPDALGMATEQIKQAFTALGNLISANSANIAWGIVAVFFVYLIQRFFSGLGNYATAAVINDKMALRARSPFTVTLIRNLKEASLYNLIYVPLAVVYDILVYAGLFYLFFMLGFLHMLPAQLFLYVTAVIAATSLKMVFTTDWLPAIIRGKMSQGQAFKFTFNRRKKKTASVLSNYIVIILLIYTLNVIMIIFTFGAAALITVPASYVLILSFEFVNFYDREELKYFIDKNTIIKPEKERVISREEFFRGEQD